MGLLGPWLSRQSRRTQMIIGVPTEIKEGENRVALTPAGVYALAGDGHHVLVQRGAGVGSSIEDAEYERAGAEIVDGAQGVFARAEMIMKVKEPVKGEFELFRPGQILFTYLHLASSEELTTRLLEAEITGIAYETVQLESGLLPLLEPMSEVAGKMAAQVAAQYLERHRGGRGVLMGGVSGVAPADVVVVGGGAVGKCAASVAAGMGAHVSCFDINTHRLGYLDDVWGTAITTLYSNPLAVAEAAAQADVVIGAVLIPGARAPHIVTQEMIRNMRPGAVIVDVSIDQGGCVETSRETTHQDPVIDVHGVLHYAVGNIPGAVPHTATFALTNATLPYVVQLAMLGTEEACRRDPSLASGVNVAGGEVVNPAVAEAVDGMV